MVWVPESEVALGRAARECLSAHGWDLYSEVQASRLSYKRADLVGCKKGLVAIFELKKSLSLEVMSQADHWIRRKVANMVGVIVPHAPGYKDARRFAVSVCKDRGIGVYQIRPSYDRSGGFVGELVVVPRLHRNAGSQELLQRLRPEHKTMAEAGSNGGYVTDFVLTRMRMIEHLREHPGMTPLELVRAVKHHYAGNRSGAQAIRKLALNGVLAGIEARIEDSKVRLYAKS